MRRLSPERLRMFWSRDPIERTSRSEVRLRDETTRPPRSLTAITGSMSRRIETLCLASSAARTLHVRYVGGRDRPGDLLHGGNLVGIAAHESPRLAIDAHDAGKRLRAARPVSSVGFGKIVGGRPDTEIRIVRDQGRSRNPLLGGCNADTETAK